MKHSRPKRSWKVSLSALHAFSVLCEYGGSRFEAFIGGSGQGLIILVGGGGGGEVGRFFISWGEVGCFCFFSGGGGEWKLEGLGVKFTGLGGGGGVGSFLVCPPPPPPPIGKVEQRQGGWGIWGRERRSRSFHCPVSPPPPPPPFRGDKEREEKGVWEAGHFCGEACCPPHQESAGEQMCARGNLHPTKLEVLTESFIHSPIFTPTDTPLYKTPLSIKDSLRISA